MTSKLVVPGVVSRGSMNLDDSAMNVSPNINSPYSPSLSAKNRRNLLEIIPGTPSPTYSYDPSNQRPMPRFFPFMTPDSERSVFASPEVSSTPIDVDQNLFSQGGTKLVSLIPAGPPIYVQADGTVYLPNSSQYSNDRVELRFPPKPFQEAPSSGTSSPSALLSRVRAGSPGQLSISEILPEANAFACDQFGSRFLQQMIECSSAADIHRIFIALLAKVDHLSTDAFGNYVIQKLIDRLPVESQVLLTEQLIGGLLALALHTYGCRVLQKIVDVLGKKREMSTLRIICKELQGHVNHCIEDQNGNHVIQRLVEKLPDIDLVIFCEEIAGKICKIAAHCYGCRVLQRLLERGVLTNSLCEELMGNLRLLSFDQFGNYVIQHLLAHGSEEVKDRICDTVANKVIDYATHKFASNVAERALVCGTVKGRARIVGALLGKGPDSSLAPPPLLLLTKDKFANYVVQRCMELSSGEQKLAVLELLKKQSGLLKKVTYGKHIIQALDRAQHSL